MGRFDRWVIDATMCEPGESGCACFCPIEGDLDGEFQVVTGFNLLAARPPHDGTLVAIVHDDGQEAVEAWCERNAAFLDALSDHPAPGPPNSSSTSRDGDT